LAQVLSAAFAYVRPCCKMEHRCGSGLPNLLLIIVGVCLGVAGFQAYQTGKNSAGKAPDPDPTPVSPVPAPPPPPPKKADFLKSVRFTGSVGSGGWKGAATYTGPHGSTFKVGTTVTHKGLGRVEAALGYKAEEWHWSPDLEVSASAKPGSKDVTYAAKASKKLDLLENGGPTMVAEVSNDAASIGAEVYHKLAQDIAVAANLRVPYSFSSKRADAILKGQTIFHVGNSKVVGQFSSKASNGLKGAKVSAEYDLGQ